MDIVGGAPPARVIEGRVIPAAGHAAGGLKVEVMDADQLEAAPLGSGATQPSGAFRVTYAAGAYAGRHGRFPDVYLLVYDHAGRVVAITRGAVVRNVRGAHEVRVWLSPAPETIRAVPTVRVGRRLVEREVLDALEPAAAERAGGDAPAGAGDAGDSIRALFERLGASPGEDLSDNFCQTPRLRLLQEIGRFKEWDGRSLERVASALTGNLETHKFQHPCPPFVIHFNLDKNDKGPVDPKTSNSPILLPGTQVPVGSTSEAGPPDYVQKICFWLHFALAAYTRPPMALRTPLGGRDIHVFVNPFGASATDGAIFVRNSFSDDRLACTLIHELMHLVQEAYEPKVQGEWHEGREGGAVLAEDFLADAINRYIAEAGTFLRRFGSLADPAQCISRLDYRQALFLKYLAEQHSDRLAGGSDPAAGLQSYRVLLEKFEEFGFVTEAVEKAVSVTSWYQSLFRFDYLDQGELDLASSETLLGNFWLACYLKDLGAAGLEPRFDFMENREPSLAHTIFQTGTPVTGLAPVARAAQAKLRMLGTVTLGSGPGSSVPPFGARFFRVFVAREVESVRVRFAAAGGFRRPLAQIILVEREGQALAIRDIFRSDRMSWDRTMANDREGKLLDHLVVIVGGTENGGAFSLSAQDVPPTPEVMVTAWNRPPGRHYEVDPLDWAWGWVSPDLWVDNDHNGEADLGVVEGMNNRLCVRLHNQGNAEATGIQVELSFQAASGRPIETAWQPVRNSAGQVQVITGESLTPQRSREFVVEWDPGRVPPGQHFNVRAVVTVPGDPNTDDKRAITGFSTVAVPQDGANVELVRRAFHGREDVKVVVARRSQAAGVVLPGELDKVNARGAISGTDRLDTLCVRPAATAAGLADAQEQLDRAVEAGASPAASWKPLTLPDPLGHYPIDPRTLPRGTDADGLITVTHVNEGKVIGGFTWAVRNARGAAPGG
ncbi:MAG TPA: hypothetical protein VFJ16_26885 [Longimicrobium sp.]|nr:hypothetical protein [Longimicrobium sp.]